MTLEGAGAGLSAEGELALVYVPALDRYLVREANAGGTVYQVDPVSFATSTFPTTGGDAIPATPNGPYNKFLYVPRLHGAVYVPAHDQPVWFLRLH